MPPLLRRVAAAAVVLGLALLGAGCAINPATGKSHISLISEDEEIELGRQSDQQMQVQVGLYADTEWQEFINSIGQNLAARSERPDLPWGFRVADDPVVNAFALPGGFIYISRGILAHFNSEAELAGVMGHEIGHVTARHSVNQMSKAQLANIGLGIGGVLDQNIAAMGDLAGEGLGLLFLKYGRDDERQADELGIRYMQRAAYAPQSMVGVFDMLDRVSAAAGAGGTPSWLATHPSPEDREVRTRALLAEMGDSASTGTVRSAEYIHRLNGLVYGDNPRNGFFRRGTFYHPDLAFRVRFPVDWATRNEASQAQAVSPTRDAVMLLSLTAFTTLGGASDQFFAPRSVARGSRRRQPISGVDSDGWAFQSSSGGMTIAGLAVFVNHKNRIFQILGYAPDSRWTAYEPLVRAAMTSFTPVQDSRVLGVKANQLEIVELDTAMTLSQFNERFPSVVPIETLVLLNRVDQTTRLPAGTLVKRVVAGL